MVLRCKQVFQKARCKNMWWLLEKYIISKNAQFYPHVIKIIFISVYMHVYVCVYTNMRPHPYNMQTLVVFISDPWSRPVQPLEMINAAIYFVAMTALYRTSLLCCLSLPLRRSLISRSWYTYMH